MPRVTPRPSRGRIAGVGGARLVARSPEAATTFIGWLALTVLGWLPGLVLAGVIDGSVSLLVAGIAAVCALATTMVREVLVRHRVLPRHAAVGVVVHVLMATAAAVGIAAVWPDRGRSAPSAVADAVVHGWSYLVTSPAPVAAEPRLTVPLAIIVWAAVGGGIAVTRLPAGRSTLLALIPGTAAFVLSCVGAGSHQEMPVVTGVAFVAAAGIFVADRAVRVSRAGAARVGPATTATIGLVAVAGLVAAVAGPALAAGRDDDPFDPREHLSSPVLPGSAQSPLDLVGRWLQKPDDDLFTVTASEPVTTRLIAFDRFDGATWRVSGGWVPAGTSLVSDDRDVPSRDVHADIEIVGLRGPWLPSFGATPAVDGIAAVRHSDSGSLAVVAGTELANGARFSIDADVAFPDLAALRDVPVADSAQARSAAELPVAAPAILREMAARATAGAPTPFMKAVQLSRYLRDNFQLDPDARPGHAYAHLVRSLTVTGVGTSEQFATGFAVLGRLAGLPTRVVVGFRPGTDDGDGTAVVRSGDVEVWPEVLFEGVGWVDFDATPAEEGDDEGSDLADIGGQQVQFVPATTEPPVDTTEPPAPEPATTEPPAAPRPDRGTPSDGGGLPDGVLWAGVALTAIAALLAAPVVWKRQRTRRRRATGDARSRVVGAWHDVLDRLVEAGDPAPRRHTVEEHVAGVATRSGALTGMYRPVSKALYGDGQLEDRDVEQAWRSRDEFVRALRMQSGRLGRIRRALDPRTILKP